MIPQAAYEVKRQISTMFESEEAFWLVQFTCFSADYKDMVSRFHTFARSVTFEE